METAIDMNPKFSLGRLFVTAGVIDALSEDEIFDGLSRHLAGDWGDVPGELWATNERALREGHRLCSAYLSKECGKKFWVVTKHDHSETAVFLPNEY